MFGGGGKWLTRNGMSNFIFSPNFLFGSATAEPANHIDAGDKRRRKIMFFIGS